MTAPTKYGRDYSFSGYQETNPADPLPGDRLDIELDNIAESISGAIDAIGTSGGSGGTPADGSVTIASLSQEVLDIFQDQYDASLITPTGATGARTLSDHFADALNVEDFGAVGDGATDDTAAIQLALAGAVGGVLRFNKRTYKISTALAVPSNITLDLNGATLDLGSSTTSPVIQALGTVDAGRDLTVNATAGARTLTVASTTGIVAGDMLRVHSTSEYDPDRTSSYRGEIVFVQSVTSTVITTTTDLQDSYATADSAAVELITPVEHVHIRGPGRIIGNTTAQSTTNAFEIFRGKHCSVSGITFEEIDLAYVRFRDCVDCHAHHNSFLRMRPNTQGYGVSFVDASQDCSATHNYFDRCRHSLSTNNSSSYGGVVRRVLFESNIVVDSEPSAGGIGGDAIDTHAAAEDIVIRNNSILGASGQGINLECRSGIIEGNLLVDITDNGIAVHNETAAAGTIIIRGNRLRNIGAIAISLRSGASFAGATAYESAIVSDNIIDDVSTYGIYVAATATAALLGTLIRGNTIRATGGSLGMIYVSDIDRFVINGNMLIALAAGQAGVRVNNSQNGVIAGNMIILASGSTAAAIVLSATDPDDTTHMLIEGNVVESPSASSSTGVSIDSDSSDVTLGVNSLEQCTTPISPTSKAIASDTLTLPYATVIAGILSVGTESGASTDNLATISGGVPGQLIVLRSAANNQDTTVKNGTGNIRLAGSDFVLDNSRDTLTLIKISTGDWLEVARSSNGS